GAAGAEVRSYRSGRDRLPRILGTRGSLVARRRLLHPSRPVRSQSGRFAMHAMTPHLGAASKQGGFGLPYDLILGKDRMFLAATRYFSTCLAVGLPSIQSVASA